MKHFIDKQKRPCLVKTVILMLNNVANFYNFQLMQNSYFNYKINFVRFFNK